MNKRIVALHHEDASDQHHLQQHPGADALYPDLLSYPEGHIGFTWIHFANDTLLEHYVDPVSLPAYVLHGAIERDKPPEVLFIRSLLVRSESIK